MYEFTYTGINNYRLNPAEDRLKETLEQLSKYYSEKPNRVIDRVYSPARSISPLADAFVIRKEKKNG